MDLTQTWGLQGAPGGCHPQTLCRRGLLAWRLLQHFGEGGQDTPLACVPVHPPGTPKLSPSIPSRGLTGLCGTPPPHSGGDSPVPLVAWGRGREEVGAFLGGCQQEGAVHPPHAIYGPALLNRASTCPGGRGKNPTPQNSRVPSPCPWKMLRHPGGGLLAPRGGPRHACQHPWVPAGSLHG